MNPLQGLNKEQQEAVLATSGPLLVIAGAGSGKTKVLVHRIAYLIAGGADPASILAVTFTNKAAKEMLERVSKFIGGAQGRRLPIWDRPWIGTFHALGAYILRESGAAIGIPRSFTILDQDDSLSIIKHIAKDFELDPKQFPPARIRHTISELKNRFTAPAEYAAEAGEGMYPSIVARVYRAYEDKLAQSASLDFDDLLVSSARLFISHKEILESYQKKWSYMLVDEYQDTNQVQYTLTQLLAAAHGNLTVVGDVDQAIYSWRGADWRNILNFERDWPNARVITLEQNYRSTKHILEAANTVIQKNIERKEKRLWTENPAGSKIRLLLAENERSEAEAVVRAIRHIRKNGLSLGSIAILYRTNAQSRAVEEALLKHNIPYRLVGGVRFYERKEIKDVLAYTRLAINPADALSALRIINTPPRGIGRTLAHAYLERARPLTGKEEEKISGFVRIRDRLRALVAEKSTTAFLRVILEAVGYEQFLRDGTPEGEDRWANVQELFTVASGYDELGAPHGTEKFLEDVALISDADQVDTSQDAVQMMTVHAAKGLEFRVVFVIGLEEGVFPHGLSMGDAREIEEERRLCYVALTRAREQLYLSLARTRSLYGERTWNEPSRFLRDIPLDLFTEPIDLDSETRYIKFE